MSTSRTYNPPPLTLIAATVVAGNPGQLVRRCTELNQLGETGLTLVFLLLERKMKLTPILIDIFYQVASQCGYTALLERLETYDVQAGIIVTGSNSCNSFF